MAKKKKSKRAKDKGPYVIRSQDHYDGERVKLPTGKYVDGPVVDPVRAKFKEKALKELSKKKGAAKKDTSEEDED